MTAARSKRVLGCMGARLLETSPGDGNRVIHRGQRRFQHWPMPNGQPRRFQLAQGFGALQGYCSGPIRPPWQREERLYDARDGDAAACLVGVTRDECPVAPVQKGNVAGRVAGRGDDLQRANHVSWRDGACWLRGADGIAAAQLVLWLLRVEAVIASHEASVAGCNQDFGLRQTLVQYIERTDMIDMRVRQRDAHDRRVKRLRGSENLLGAAGEIRIDEGKAVLFAHQEAVKRPHACELVEMFAMSRRFHGWFLSCHPTKLM